MKSFIKIGKTVCVVLMATCMLTSCDGALDKITGAMDRMNSSVWEETGIVKPDTSVADTAIAAVATEKTEVAMTPWTGTENIGAAVVDLNLTAGYEDLGGFVGTVTIKDKELADRIAGGVLSPQSDEQKSAMQTGIAEALATESGTKVLKEALEKELDEKDTASVKGTMALASGVLSKVAEKTKSVDQIPEAVNQVLETLAASFADGAKSNETVKESDRVQMQIVTNITTSAATLAEGILSEDSSGGSQETAESILEKPEVKEMINSVLQLAEVSELVPSIVNVDMNSLISMVTEAVGN